ncbi:unnamed protein product [Nesidiocoris tenuis]|uniref:Uncharacterized protein n=1 Tax=Nesidiocoris tenuis TaxID=355587 RepID=A0A6H5GDZ3_9HEMI|nr:unnamed protein product [Nesidiocoris tenuis]
MARSSNLTRTTAMLISHSIIRPSLSDRMAEFRAVSSSGDDGSFLIANCLQKNCDNREEPAR